MVKVSYAARRWAAPAVWAAGLLFFLVLGISAVNEVRREAEKRLSSEAGRTAAQLAALLSLPAWELDELTARTIVMAAMEDDNIYAVKVQTGRGMLEGQRRNHRWEPVPWDDVVPKETVQGMNPLKMEGRTIGHVEVYLTSRADKAAVDAAVSRETRRFVLLAVVSTAILLLLLRQWGELARLYIRLRLLLPLHGRSGQAEAEQSEAGQNRPERIVVPAFFAAPAHADSAARRAESVAGLTGHASAHAADEAVRMPPDTLLSPSLGRLYQRTHPDAWQVTAGLFRQSFAPAPALMSRLYADGEKAGLCRLGLLLEKSALCLGAARLAGAAGRMQAALNDPECDTAGLCVEECIDALEEVLTALNQG